MTSARSSLAHAEHGPRTYPLTRSAWTFFRAGAAAIGPSLVLDLLAALLPVDPVLPAEVAVRTHVVENRIIPVGVLDEVHFLRPTLGARLALLAQAVAAEHRAERGEG